MIRIENVDVYGWEAAIRGMRNPKNSGDKSDTKYVTDENHPGHYFLVVGDNDLALMQTLADAGTDHGKFLRMITVTADITSNHVWWAEFDTYKVGTVRNSCSKMHKIHAKTIAHEDFSFEGIREVGGVVTETFERVGQTLEWLRTKYVNTGEKKYWRALIELLPMGYNLRATVQLNYAVSAICTTHAAITSFPSGVPSVHGSKPYRMRNL